MVLALPVPIIVSNFIVAHDLLENDCTVTTFYFDKEKSEQVKKELHQNNKRNGVVEEEQTSTDVFQTYRRLVTTQC